LRFTVADHKRFQVILKLLRTRSNEELVDLFDKFEQGLEFVGITAVNDELQENVKETLETFREAGVRVWVLTGDQLQTTLSIA
jgi:magnesium-transporting ATPase (P-type)